MITTRGLVKRYGHITAVDGIHLDVRAGDIYGFLGANGSGKTTTVRMLLGLALATAGEIEMFDQPMPKRAAKVLPRVGALVEGPAAYDHLSAKVNLNLLDAAGRGGSRRSRKKRIVDVLEQVGLGDVGRRPVKQYSLGMRQRLGLAGALLRKPELLILDEPTNGLDPQGIREIRELILGLHREGTTVFLSSHLLAEVEQMCTRVGVLDRGQLVLQDQLATLQAPTGRTLITAVDPAAAVALLDGRVVGRNGAELVVRGEAPQVLNTMLVSAGVDVLELRAERHSLEQIVLAATEPDHPPATAAQPAPVPETDVAQ